MSRAFVKESDEDLSALPERVISPHPNFVTPAGHAQIESQVQALEQERSAARTAGDRARLATIERDLRYWTQRRASARVVEPVASPRAVRFGVRVQLRFDDGSERSFRLVGEDEADPAGGMISWVSPIGESLTGCEEGDEVHVLGRRAEIVALES
jgi:transcription elongation GreA/GreB family factor